MFKLFGECFLGNTSLDLRPLAYGNRMCTPDYTRTLEVSTNYIIHYIVSGTGVFTKNGVSYSLSAGQMFISTPNEVFGFKADTQDPWHFIWIKFTGNLAQKLHALPTVLHADGTPFLNMLHCDSESNTVEEYITAQLYILFSKLFASEKRHDYVSIIKNYIRSRPDFGKITVDEIQQYVCLNRQYMSTLFKKEAGMSIQQFIITARMERGQFLLSRGYSVAEVAEHCGYSSIFAFSKTFKKTYGINPTDYKKTAKSR